MFNMHGDSKRINCTLNNKGKQSTEFKMHFKEINVRTKVTSTIATDRDGKKIILTRFVFYTDHLINSTIF